MRGIGYCRVSTDEQVVDGFSLDTQEREIREYCKNNNIELLRVYVDSGVSAFKFSLCERPEGKFVFEHSPFFLYALSERILNIRRKVKAKRQ